MWRIHVAIGDMDVSAGYMNPSTTCGGYMLPSATWMYPKIHVSKHDMWRIHVAVGDMDASKGYVYPSTICIRYMCLDMYSIHVSIHVTFKVNLQTSILAFDPSHPLLVGVHH